MRRAGLDQVRGVGGIGVIPPDWRARFQDRPKPPNLRDWTRRVRRQLDELKRRPRPDLHKLWNQQKQRDYRALLYKHRVKLAVFTAVALFASADSSFDWGVSDRTPGPGEAQRVAFAHEQLVQSTVPSVKRYLAAIANGERIREQAVVAAAARATLDRAKAEAAAAASGEYQPWMSAGTPLPPGAILPGIGGMVLPTRGTFTSGFGSRWGTFHNGIDVAGPIGTPIYAVANGTVIDAGPAQGFGLWVRIRHDDGTITVYGHMYDFFVSVGERVPAGMQIARMGNRGDSSGPHLHFEVIAGGQHVDPRAWLAVHGLGF
ncbi:M23 family metallopeptidase [Nocardia sp. XZ_19_385]|uniref:M23 family metallopeptidase n=1 Tax=Nocardia sp. XZ_19_385 TaxID=2769488 RepID=UPI002815BA29|nr:M23 family metallopeptidase [Nocardia sp. XZ_19_385]